MDPSVPETRGACKFAHSLTVPIFIIAYVQTNFCKPNTPMLSLTVVNFFKLIVPKRLLCACNFFYGETLEIITVKKEVT